MAMPCPEVSNCREVSPTSRTAKSSWRSPITRGSAVPVQRQGARRGDRTLLLRSEVPRPDERGLAQRRSSLREVCWDEPIQLLCGEPSGDDRPPIFYIDRISLYLQYWLK